jgi:hypothetical protein
MSPMFGEFSAAVEELREGVAIVWAETRERNHVMRHHDDVHAVDLQEAQAVDGVAKVADGDARGAGQVEALRGECQATRFS